MGNTLDIIKARRSSRKFTGEIVPDEIVEKIVEAGLYAASGRNRQSPIIIVVNDKETRDMLSRVNQEINGGASDPFYGAKQVLVVLSKKEVTTHVYDGSLVLGNMMLACEELGIGSCWIHRARETFEREEGKKLLAKLGITEEYEGIGNLIIGYDDNGKRDNAARNEGRVFWVK